MSLPARGWPWPCFRPSYSDQFIPSSPFRGYRLGYWAWYKSECCGRFPELSYWV